MPCADIISCKISAQIAEVNNNIAQIHQYLPTIVTAGSVFFFFLFSIFKVGRLN